MKAPQKRPITFCRGLIHWLSKAEFESVKASGMFGEFYPDQPDRWELLPDPDATPTPPEPRGLLMRARTDRADRGPLGPYVEFLTLQPQPQENAKALALQFLRGICSGESLFFIREDGQHEVWHRSALEAWSRPAPSPTSPAPMQQLFPALAAHLRRMTKNGLTGTLLEWDSFLSDLNAALLGDELKAAVAERSRLQSLIDADPHARLFVCNTAVLRTNKAEAELATLRKEVEKTNRVIGGVRHENEKLRGVERALRKQVAEFEKLFGLDTPWPVVSLYKSLVIAETQLRRDGRDFDGWESIQAAAAVAQQRVSDFLKE